MDFKYTNRREAGISLLNRFKNQLPSSPFEIVAIPNGGIRIAEVFARFYNKPIRIFVSQKIHLSHMPFIGLGALTARNIYLNQSRIDTLQLTKEQLDFSIESAIHGAKQKIFFMKKYILENTEKNILLFDDGIASGYTVLGAIRDLQQCYNRQIIVLSPVISNEAYKLLKRQQGSHDIMFEHLSEKRNFMVDDYYKEFSKIKNNEANDLLFQINAGGRKI